MSARFFAVCFLFACGSSQTMTGDDAGGDGTVTMPPDSGMAVDTGTASDAADAAKEASTACSGDTLDANRNRLLETYYAYLKTTTVAQSNGLSNSVTSAVDVWQKLDPSSRAVFLTITARMQGSLLGKDGTSMLSHVTKVYRIVGGQGATQNDPGTCGGGENNRMIMSMDATLHDAQLAANTHKGALQQNNKYDIGDVIPSSYWRDSHDLGGAHAPFDISDETNGGAPRGQTQYFKDPNSTLAKTALGRQDLATLVDPYALEMDQDYDCVHNSNPLCPYITYGQLCIPMSSKLGTDIYMDSYGSYGSSYMPQPCQ